MVMNGNLHGFQYVDYVESISTWHHTNSLSMEAVKEIAAVNNYGLQYSESM